MISPRFARLDFPRRPIRRRREPGIAHTAAAALRDEDALAFLGKIGEQALRFVRIPRLLEHERADRDLELHVAAGAPGAVRSLAVPAALGGELGMEAVVDEGVGVRARDDVDRTAGAAVSAARTAARHELLAPERQAAAAAAAGFDVDVDFVYKHREVGELMSE